jgi:hypothetical protein
MNERFKELVKQAWTENDWDGHVDIPKLIQLVRAEEREACAKVCDEWPNGRDDVYSIGEAIRARRRTHENF